MRTYNYYPVPEIISEETIRARKQALKNLAKAKEREKELLNLGKKYIKIDPKTFKLK